MSALTPPELARIAELSRWRAAWLQLAHTVRSRANDRAIRWVERHVKAQRFEDQMPWQYPDQKRRKFEKRETLYLDRLMRADAHTAKANRCSDEIARIRAEARARQPTQAALFA